QLDRVVAGMRARSVRLFGAPGVIPEGPLRIAQLARVPIIPVFCARLGFRRYVVELGDSVELGPRPTSAEFDVAAQALADAMTSSSRRPPTQCSRFSGAKPRTARAGSALVRGREVWKRAGSRLWRPVTTSARSTFAVKSAPTRSASTCSRCRPG